MTTKSLILPTEVYGWVDLIAGFLQGSVVRLSDHYELQCDSAALKAVDALMAASRVFNIPYSKNQWPTNWTYVMEPIKAVSATFDALMICHIGSAWWSENWSMDMGDDEEMDMEEEDAPDDEDAADGEEDMGMMEEMLTKVRVQKSDPVDEEESAASEVVDLGHIWDDMFMREAFDYKVDIDDKVKGFIYDAIDAKNAGLEDGSVEYYVKEDREKEREDVARMRDQFGLDRTWEAVWCLTTDTVGILQNYDKGYYFWHLGRYFGRSIVSVVTILDWSINYPPLQQYFALMFQEYSDAYWSWKDGDNMESDDSEESADAPVDETEAVDTEELF